MRVRGIQPSIACHVGIASGVRRRGSRFGREGGEGAWEELELTGAVSAGLPGRVRVSRTNGGHLHTDSDTRA